MEETFNVGNPTKENIDCAFKNLIFYVTSSTLLDLYRLLKVLIMRRSPILFMII